MKAIYVAGSYSNHSIYQQHLNVNRAVEVTYGLLEEGYAVVCPIITYGYFDLVYDLPYQVYLKADFEILKRCDAIYMLKNWQSSFGAKCEHRLAKWLGLQVIYE